MFPKPRKHRQCGQRRNCLSSRKPSPFVLTQINFSSFLQCGQIGHASSGASSRSSFFAFFAIGFSLGRTSGSAAGRPAGAEPREKLVVAPPVATVVRTPIPQRRSRYRLASARMSTWCSRQGCDRSCTLRVASHQSARPGDRCGSRSRRPQLKTHW